MGVIVPPGVTSVPAGAAGRSTVEGYDPEKHDPFFDGVSQRLADKGPVNVDDPRVILPPKEEVYNTIEGTIQHFKIVMEGLKLPAGEELKEHQVHERAWVLVIDGDAINVSFAHASGNLYGVNLLPAVGANVYDILKADTLVLTRAAIEKLEARFNG